MKCSIPRFFGWLVPGLGPQIKRMKRISGPAGQDPQTYAIIGAAMEVHRVLGFSFLEPVYQAALELEFARFGIPYSREVNMPIHYKGNPLPVRYRADFVCYGEVLVELKAIGQLTGREEGQIINYLAASQLRRGVLLNFGSRSLEFMRFLAPTNRSKLSPGQSVSSV